MWYIERAENYKYGVVVKYSNHGINTTIYLNDLDIKKAKDLAKFFRQLATEMEATKNMPMAY